MLSTQANTSAFRGKVPQKGLAEGTYRGTSLIRNRTPL